MIVMGGGGVIVMGGKTGPARSFPREKTEIVFSYKIVQHPYFNKLPIHLDENNKEDIL